MAIKNTTSGGIIGLGSRLFIGKENTWGSPLDSSGNALVIADDWLQYNFYNQAGSRPQKIKNSIEVSQLYPSVVRRKTIKNTTQIEGSYVFSIPTTNSGVFWEMITGDESAGSSSFTTKGGNITIGVTGSSATDTVKFTTTSAITSADVVAGDTVQITDSNVEENAQSYIANYTVASVDYTNRVITTTALASNHYQVKTENIATAGHNASDNAGALNIDSNANKELVLDINTSLTADAINKVISVTIGNITTNAGLTNQGLDISEINGAFTDDNATFVWSGTNLAITVPSVLTDDANQSNLTYSGDAEIDIEYQEGDTVGLSTNKVLKVGSDLAYTVQPEVENSYRILQTHGLSFASRYDGMMAQSATISISPDDVANVDIAFLGKDEITRVAAANGIGGLFEGLSGNADDATNCPFDIVNGATGATTNPYKIQDLKDGFKDEFDNFVDYYPSFSASLYAGKKVITAGTAGAGKNVAWHYLDGDFSGADQYTANSGSAGDATYWAKGSVVPGQNFLLPFADATITISNNLEFPTYINGTNARTKPIQTTFRDISVGLTLPYNQFSYPLVQSMFDEDSWALKIILSYGAVSSASTKKIVFDLPEVCITGDGGLGDIPEGEVTIPLTFTAYAPHEIQANAGISEDDSAYDSIYDNAPLSVYVS